MFKLIAEPIFLHVWNTPIYDLQNLILWKPPRIVTAS